MGQSCERASGLDGVCESDLECHAAFSVCEGGRCVCSSGSQRLGSECLASCPDGSTPVQSCGRSFLGDLDILQHAEKMDNCPPGFGCSVYGKPFMGACCPLRCAYGAADLSRSCETGAELGCRELTHSCESIWLGAGWSARLCCPRPCREPLPVYVGGECAAAAHRGDRCGADEECEGGRTMRCGSASRRCECRPSFIPVQTDFFPSCIRACAADSVSVGTGCLDKTGLGKRCLMDAQCPAGARCFLGVCGCRCGLVQGGLLNDTCVDPFDPLNVGSFIKGYSLRFLSLFCLYRLLNSIL